MKALSLLQPWASLVVMGVKKIETRSWSTQYRGELLIHASLGKTASFLAEEFPYKKYITDFKKLSFGMIIGKVYLRDIVKIKTGEMYGMSDEIINALTLEEKAFGDYTENRYAWMLQNPEQFAEPIPAKGMISLWDFNYKHQ